MCRSRAEGSRRCHACRSGPDGGRRARDRVRYAIDKAEQLSLPSHHNGGDETSTNVDKKGERAAYMNAMDDWDGAGKQFIETNREQIRNLLDQAEQAYAASENHLTFVVEAEQLAVQTGYVIDAELRRRLPPLPERPTVSFILALKEEYDALDMKADRIQQSFIEAENSGASEEELDSIEQQFNTVMQEGAYFEGRLQAIINPHEFGLPPEDGREWLQAQSSAARQLLEEVREMGPGRMTLTFDESSDEEGVAAVKRAMRHYPKDWIKKSVKGSSLSVQHTDVKGRGMYIDRTELEDDNGKPMSVLVTNRTTAVHEFAHRMEHVDPRLGWMEQAFLHRRTTRSDGSREEPVRWDGTERYVYQDGFVNEYVGLVTTDDRFHEVLSTGTEAIFDGGFEGLVGTTSCESDPDHKAFVLGTLATV